MTIPSSSLYSAGSRYTTSPIRFGYRAQANQNQPEDNNPHPLSSRQKKLAAAASGTALAGTLAMIGVLGGTSVCGDPAETVQTIPCSSLIASTIISAICSIFFGGLALDGDLSRLNPFRRRDAANEPAAVELQQVHNDHNQPAAVQQNPENPGIVEEAIV